MTQHNYLPGDRVVALLYRNNSPFKETVTVKATPPERQTPEYNNSDYVYLDVPGSHNYHNIHYTDLKPAPIKAGDSVRFLNVAGFAYDRVVSLYRHEDGKIYAKFAVTSDVDVDNLRAIDPNAPMVWNHDKLTTGTAGELWKHTPEMRWNGGVLEHAMQNTANGDIRWEAVPVAMDPALKQAQDLAIAIHEKHFKGIAPEWKVQDDLSGVLLQIDNMTAGMMAAHEINNMSGQIERLAEYIMQNVPGEPSQSEGAGDCAVRIMTAQRDKLKTRESALNTAAELLGEWITISGPDKGNKSRKWLEQFGFNVPEAVKFNRGDLVTWGTGSVNYRIVGDPKVNCPELMAESGSHFRNDICITNLRRVDQ